MTNNKQSSVEWLLSFIEPSLTPEQKHFFSMVIEQAKAMHKEEIMDAFQSGKWDWADNVKHGLETKDPAEYYNETFGGNK